MNELALKTVNEQKKNRNYSEPLILSQFVRAVLENLYTLCVFSHVWLFATSWTVASQAPLSLEFSRQEYWSGLPFTTPGDLPNPGIDLASFVSPSLVGRFLPLGHLGSPHFITWSKFIGDGREWEWLDSITDSMDMNLNKIQKVVEDRVAWHPTVHGIAKSLTQFSNWTTTTSIDGVYYFLLLSTVFIFLCPYQTGISA